MSSFAFLFFRKARTIFFCFCSANLPGFLRCFRFAPTFSYIVCQNLKSLYFSVENFLVVHTLYQFRQSTTSIGAMHRMGVEASFLTDDSYQYISRYTGFSLQCRYQYRIPLSLFHKDSLVPIHQMQKGILYTG